MHVACNPLPDAGLPTALRGASSGSRQVQCECCGCTGIELWHEEAVTVPNRGAQATRFARVSDGYRWGHSHEGTESALGGSADHPRSAADTPPS